MGCLSGIAYVEVESDKIKKACDDYLAKRRARIDGKREKMIEQEMKTWFFPAKTREQAIKRLKSRHNNLFFNDWELVTIPGGGPAGRVEDLRVLADLSSTVMIDSYMAGILFGG